MMMMWVWEMFEGEIIDGEYLDVVMMEEEVMVWVGGSVVCVSGLVSGLVRLDALSEAMGAVYVMIGDVVDVGGLGDEDVCDDDVLVVLLGVIDVGVGGEMVW